MSNQSLQQEKSNLQKQVHEFDNQFDKLVLDSNMIRLEEEKRLKKEKKQGHTEVLRENWDTQKKFAEEKRLKQIYD